MEYKIPEIIRRVGDYLRLPTPTHGLKEHIIGLESLRYDLADQTTKQLLLLHDKRAQVLLPKDKEFTELDRKIAMDASVSVIERDYLFLEKLEGLVKDRIELAKSILSQETKKN